MIDNMEDINHKMYKYGVNAINVKKNESTNLSISNAAPSFVELIKIEKFSMTWMYLHKIQKPIELILGIMTELKNIFKCSKCTLFIVDK
jgi:hypothetical protein